MKKSLILMALLLICAGMLSAVSVVIGTGTTYNTSTGSPSPYANYYANERDQYLITAAELNAAGGGGGYITSLAFNVFAVNGCGSKLLNIKMGHTSQAVLTSTFVTGLTPVYTNASYQPVVGWNTHTLTGSGFLWNGTSSIVVEVVFGVPGTYTYNAGVYYTSTSALYKTTYYRSDTVDANTSLTGTTSYNRANITFDMAAYVPAVPGPAAIVSPLDTATLVLRTATLNWAAGGGAPTGYKLQYGTNPAGDNLMPLTDISTVTTYDPAGLFTYGQPYYWKVVPYNAIGDCTTAPVWSFTIEPDPTITVFPHLQDFGITTTFPPLNWKLYSGVLADPSVLVTGGSWYSDDWLNVTAPVNKAAKINIYGTTAQGWIITPPIQMPGTGYQLEFDVAYMAWNGLSTPPVTDGTGDRFEVLIGDGTTWAPANIVRSWDNAGGTYVLNNISPSGEHVTLDISSYTGVKYVAFYAHNGAVGARDNDLMVDNVLIRETPAGGPDAVTLNAPADGATGLLKSGFNLSWTPAVTGGTPDYFVVYMSMDEGTIYDDVNFETTLSSLNPTTFAGGPSLPITFNYDERWYWTVEAVNGGGSAVVEPARWFEIESDPTIVIPHLQPFAALTMPSGWTQTKDGTLSTLNWHISATATAGGTANEMYYNYQSGIGVSRLITPPIDTDGIGEFICEFKNYYDDYGAGITAKLQYSHDLVNWFDSSWSIIGGSGNDVGTRSILINGLAAPITYIAWVMDGDCFQMDAWYIDDVSLYIPLNWDVAPVSIDMPEVVEAVALTPQATIINNGINAATFNVRMDIGTWNNTQNITIAAGGTLQVPFASYLPTVFTAETVTVTTLLATDENTANDVLTGVLICLPLDTPALANNAQTDQFVQFNLSDPATLVPMATAYTGTYFMSGADWMNGNWMAVEYDDATLVTDNYYEIDPLTGVYLPSLGEPGAALMGIAYDDNGATGILYGVGGSNGGLYTMDPITGLATLVDIMWYNNAGTPTDLPDLSGLMIDCAYDTVADVLYGIDLGNDCLWTINPATAELTLKGYFGVDLNYAQDAAFDQENGLLFLCGYSSFGGLYWVDTVNGGAYLIGALGALGYELDGFAIPYGLITVPDPAVATTGELSWAPVEGAIHYQILKATEPYGVYAPYATAYGTTWTDTLYSEGMAFYQVVAVGGVRNARQAVQFEQPIRKAGKLNQQKRFNIGIAK